MGRFDLCTTYQQYSVHERHIISSPNLSPVQERRAVVPVPFFLRDKYLVYMDGPEKQEGLHVHATESVYKTPLASQRRQALHTKQLRLHLNPQPQCRDDCGQPSSYHRRSRQRRGGGRAGSSDGASLYVCGNEACSATGVYLVGTCEISLGQGLVVGSCVVREDFHRVVQTLVASWVDCWGQCHPDGGVISIEVDRIGLVQDGVAEAVVSGFRALEARRLVDWFVCR